MRSGVRPLNDEPRCARCIRLGSKARTQPSLVRNDCFWSYVFSERAAQAADPTVAELTLAGCHVIRSDTIKTIISRHIVALHALTLTALFTRWPLFS